MNENLLAFSMGYAFSHAIDIQHRLGPSELTVPYVIYWEFEKAIPVPYPAATQEEAVGNAHAARNRYELNQYSEGSAWSSGREGLVAQSDGMKVDALLIEGWVPGLTVPLEMFVYYRKSPFRLIKGFMWKNHPQARRDGRTFMAEFKRGIQAQSFGQQCLECVERAEPVITSA